MSTTTPVLSFRDVAVSGAAPYESAVLDVSFELHRGELMLVLLEKEQVNIPLADAAQGLVEPSHGHVEIRGRDWRQMTAREASRQRGRMGRIFSRGGWLNSLDVDENITLASRHHTLRRPEAIVEHAAVLARRFGLPGLPLGKAPLLRRQDLQKAACVRAFLLDPEVLIAEDPTVGVHADIIGPLVNAILEARRHGTAVLWATSNRKVWQDAGLQPDSRWQMTGAHLVETE